MVYHLKRIGSNIRYLFKNNSVVYVFKVKIFPLKNISSIQYETEMVFGEITIFISGNCADITYVDKRQAGIFNS